MDNVPFKIINNGNIGIIRAEKEYFERECILRVASQYTQGYTIAFYPAGESAVEVRITAKNTLKIDEDVLKEFLNECIDTQVRIDLQKEFGSLRQRIVDYAFAAVEKKHV